MESIEQFLEQDIPLFLDGFANGKKTSAAEADEISALLKPVKEEVPVPKPPTNINITINKLSKEEEEEFLKKAPKPKKKEEKKQAIVEKKQVVEKKQENETKEETLTLTIEEMKRIQKERPEQIGIKNTLDEYVIALKALEKKDKLLAVSSFYLLATKFPNNIAILTRLHDALNLDGEQIKVPPIMSHKEKRITFNNKETNKKQEKKKQVVEKKQEKKKTNKTTIEINTAIKDPLEKYVIGINAIKENNKELAIKIFEELVKEYPKNISFKLRLQEALKM